MERAAPAMNRKVSTVLETSSAETAFGLPALTDSSRSNRPAFCSTRSAIASRIAPRSLGVKAPQAGWADRAAVTAASTSSTVPSGTRANTDPLDGSTTSMNVPDEPARNAPSMKCCAGGRSPSLSSAGPSLRRIWVSVGEAVVVM